MDAKRKTFKNENSLYFSEGTFPCCEAVFSLCTNGRTVSPYEDDDGDGIVESGLVSSFDGSVEKENFRVGRKADENGIKALIYAFVNGAEGEGRVLTRYIL